MTNKELTPNQLETKRKLQRNYYYRKVGLTKEQAEERERQFQEKNNVNPAPTADTALVAKRLRQKEWARNRRAQRNGDSEDIKLVSICPCCGARIYAKKGGD